MRKDDERIINELVPDFQLKVAGWQDVRFIVTPGHGYLEVEDNPENRQFFSQFSYERGGKLYLEEDDDASKWLKYHGLESYKDIPTVYAEDDRKLKFLMASRNKRANCKKAEEETVRQEGGQYIGRYNPTDDTGFNEWLRENGAGSDCNCGAAQRGGEHSPDCIYTQNMDALYDQYLEFVNHKTGAKTAANLDPSREFLMGQCGACAKAYEWGDGAHVYCPDLDAPKHYMESCDENQVGMPKPQRADTEARMKREVYSRSEQEQVRMMNELVPDEAGLKPKSALGTFDDYQDAYDAAVLAANEFGRDMLLRKVDEYGKTRYALSFATAIDSSLAGEVVHPATAARKTAGMIPIAQVERAVYDIGVREGRAAGELDILSAWATVDEVNAYFDNSSEIEIRDAIWRDSTLKLEGDRIGFARNPLMFTDENGKTKPKTNMDYWGKFSKCAISYGVDTGNCYNCESFGQLHDGPDAGCTNPESDYYGDVPPTLRCSLYRQGDTDWSGQNMSGVSGLDAAKHAGKRLVVSEANSFKLQEHGDGTYDVLDGEGNVVMSQESYQVASNFVEGSPRGEYSETDEVGDAIGLDMNKMGWPEDDDPHWQPPFKTSAREYSSEEIEQARALGEKAFQEGAIKAPAQDPELLAMLEGNQVGEGIPILKAWKEGYHAMNADQDVEGWTDEENQALRDAREGKTAEAVPMDSLIQFFTENPNPPDSDLHAWAEEQGLEPDDVETQIYALVTELLKQQGDGGEKAAAKILARMKRAEEDPESSIGDRPVQYSEEQIEKMVQNAEANGWTVSRGEREVLFIRPDGRVTSVSW